MSRIIHSAFLTIIFWGIWAAASGAEQVPDSADLEQIPFSELPQDDQPLAHLLDAQIPPPLEAAYFSLDAKIRELEHEPSTREKAVSTLSVMLLDLLFEVVHQWSLQSYSPEYYYRDSAPPDLPESLSRYTRLFLSTVKDHHVPVALSGLLSWAGMYGGNLPNISGNDFYHRLGVMAGLTAAGYFLLGKRTITMGETKDSWKKSFLRLLSTREALLLRDTPEHDKGRNYFMAAVELDYAKTILQTTIISMMTFWNIATRFQHQAELNDLKLSLRMARDRLQGSNKTENTEEHIQD
ncbi:hypothetical protein M3P05_03525 [Sansalvadorimonas sp. 2012CJ34-2]|uniref:Uncharacterized protein n=1 Tax=Parendozoicomonas callyspongiae TaxID=2942213 RepID=A0ABT0PC99_9GAMM|nr:hypothetical protein [Sansalvadorimonas sp. 2012CJ34-2]MCL6269012.1 hypothetical protein [Sansalvadorimonas sp. 2012CJ34-2]